MSRRRSPIVGKRYPLRTVCEVWHVPRSTVYAGRAATTADPAAAKRGPKTVQSDAELVTLIREILATSPFHSEGTARSACGCATGGSTSARPGCCA